MRWDELFAELEGQWEAMAASERAGEIAERTRAELAQVQLLDRLRASLDQELALTLRGGQRVTGQLCRVGGDFVLMALARVEAVIPVSSLVSVSGLRSQAQSAEQAGPIATRLRIGSVLRGITADRSAVTVSLTTGEELHGTPRRVGADFLEIAEHPVGAWSRAEEVRRVSAVPFPALALVRRELDPDFD